MSFKRALITGASSGLGKHLAHLLASKNIPLILSARNQTRLEQVAKSVNAQETLLADLSKKVDRAKLISLIHQKKPDLVINNAGFAIYGDALSIPVQEQLDILEVNGAAALELTLEAARTLIAAKREGVIVNVSSIAGDHPCPGMSVYGGAKAFLTMSSQALNEELKEKGVHVLVSCPGMVATEFANRAAKKELTQVKGVVLQPNYAAEQIWKQICLKKEKYIFNWQYRVSSFLATHFTPVKIVKRIIWNRIKQRL